ncbi:30S ribosomal protein S1 [Defluviitalea phaphyphila]|uniref:30S ribosomal protein S1 n=1 Tax=Defluviitalea phaphyphila TaxID=1473580 RepID=UPI00073058F3|nr:30S ribosomal protein S1 [Defluviitalea phaphyphila]
MEKNYTEETTMDQVMEDIEKNMKKLRPGDIVKGKVIKVTEDEVLVNIGYMSDGIITKQEVCEDENIDPRDILKEEDEIDVCIIQLDDGEGNVVLSKKQADRVVVWEELNDYYTSDTPFEVKIKETVKGGVVANIKGVRGFIPASHLSIHYVEDLNEYVGKTLKVKLIEFDKATNKVVLSRKVVEQEERELKKQELFKSLQKGEKRKGVITKLTKFGAFVDLGGVEGLIHLSDLSWKRVLDPAEVVKIGDKVEVYVIDFDEKKERISLGLKDITEDPWNEVSNKYQVNDIVEGKVVRIANFGAFVEIEPGVEGLVHISQISDKHIAKVSEVISVGDKVKAKIIELNTEEKRIGLSIREAKEDYREDISKYNNDEQDNITIGDILKDKLKGLKF